MLLRQNGAARRIEGSARLEKACLADKTSARLVLEEGTS